MPLPALERRLRSHAADPSRLAVIDTAGSLSYAELLKHTDQAAAEFAALGIGAGDCVMLQTGFSGPAIASFLALLRMNAVAVLVSPNDPQPELKLEDAGCCLHLKFPLAKPISSHSLSVQATGRHALIDDLMKREHPGFVVFSSGSSGHPKAVLHDASQFCSHLEAVTKAKSTVGFLAFDHIAGVDTLFYTLFAGGSLLIPEDRSPLKVCELIERTRAQVLPVSPSFLKLLLVSPALERCDLSSLEIVTFGSEPPDPVVVERLSGRLPGVQLLQKYGTSEFGAPRSRTRPGDSRWIKLSSDNLATQVRDGILWVQASGTMLGYLNVDSPDISDGWYCTGDRVEQDGEWLRILGRDSDMINVGGEKVFPAEVESTIESMPEVAECAVTGEAHPLLGNVVVATVRPTSKARWADAKRAIRRYCKGRLPRHAIPVKVRLTDEALTSERGKRVRGNNAAPDS